MPDQSTRRSGVCEKISSAITALRGGSVAAFSVVATVAVALGVTLAMAVSGAGVVADPASSPPDHDEDGYAIVQGDQCVEIEPVGNGLRTVEEFYDYRTPETDPSSYSYSSHGTTDIQADDTSSLFLYEGSDGLSLVFVHGQYEGDSTGGAVTMLIDGLPEDGEWPVEDDNYSDELANGSSDEFIHGETASQITWTWNENRTDGAAFRGLGDEFDVTIDPAFNDDADFRIYDGEVDDWQVVSADGYDYERTSLDMDEQVRITTGSCTSFAADGLETNGTAFAGDATDLEATVTNYGELADTFDVTFTVDDEVVDEQQVTLDPGETATLTTTVEFDEPGTYTVGVGNATTDVTVTENTETEEEGNESDGEDTETETTEETETETTDENDGNESNTETTEEVTEDTETETAEEATNETETETEDDDDTLPGFGAVAVLLALVFAVAIARYRP